MADTTTPAIEYDGLEIEQERRWRIGPAGDDCVGSIRCYYMNILGAPGGGNWLVTDLWIARDHRRHGLGTRLMRALIETMRYDELHLMASPFDYDLTRDAIPRDTLIAFYRKFGFESVDERMPYMMIRPAEKKTLPVDDRLHTIARKIDPMTIGPNQYINFNRMPMIPDYGEVHDQVRRIVDNQRPAIWGAGFDDRPQIKHDCDYFDMVIDRFANTCRCKMCGRLSQMYFPCLNCYKPVSIDHAHCPWCGAANTNKPDFIR